MSIGEINELGRNDVQDYIFAHTNDDEKKLVLKHKLINGLPASLVAQQISARRKAETKLPTFFQRRGVVYPPSLNLEQSSSEITAKFKCNVLRKEISHEKIKMADLTGGFGMDSFFFSQISNYLDYVEPNADLIEIVKHNFEVCKTANVHFHNKTAETFLSETSTNYDFIFIDPSRRDSKLRKVFTLADCAPDVTKLLSTLSDRADFILIKASPLLDIKQGLNELKAVKKVIVVSVANECKELLFLCEKNLQGETTVESFNLDAAGETKHTFNFLFSEEEISTSEFSPPQKYLYEPNASILKAGAFKLIGEKFSLKKIEKNTHLYTSNTLQNDFPGRIFEIEEQRFDPKSLLEKKVNIITRNYPLTPDELKKKFKLKDGGEKYVIGFSGQEKKHLVRAKRLA